MAAPRKLCMTDVVRQIFQERNNRAMRLPRLWEQVVARAPADVAMSKNHFKRHVIDQLMTRGIMVKTHVLEEVKGKGLRDFYGLRLKNNASNRELMQASAQKLTALTPSGGASAPAAAAAAAAAARGSASSAAGRAMA